MGINNIFFSNVDIIIGIIIAVYCIIGFVKGVIRQFFGILAFLLATAASIIVPFFVNLPATSGLSPIWGFAIFSTLIFVPAFLIINSIGKFIAKRMVKKGIKFSDRLWGFFFGGLKGLIIIIITVFFVDLLPHKVKQSVPFLNSVFTESKIAAGIKPYNPLLKIQIMQNLESVISALSDPDYLELLDKDAGFQQLRQNENIKLLINNPDLRKILTERQYLKFITNPEIQTLINDEEAVKLLMTVDVDKAVIKNI